MKALVVIDVQKAMFAMPGLAPYDGENVVARIAELIARARGSGTPVFFVEHDGGPDDPFHAGKPGFPFHERLTPQSGDDVTVKHRGSAFHDTDFDARLKRAGIDHLVVTGMQSEYCIDSAIRGAVERGYTVTLPRDAHSTFGTKIARATDIIAIMNDTLNGSYATVVSTADVSFD
jgi:nicotinamidase-related amidase